MSSLRALAIAVVLALWPRPATAQDPKPDSRPVIGIEADVQVDPVTGEKKARVAPAYLDAVRAAGGIPRVISALESTAKDALVGLDAVVLTGGDDIPSSEYGEASRTTDKTVDPARLAFGKALIQLAFEARVPLLGICYGNQLINVVRGGRLIQDIPSEIAHALEHRQGGADTRHDVAIDLDSELGKDVGATSEINSFHHQSVAVAGLGLRVVARAPDGVNEAVEGTDPAHWVTGVQWHPERLGAVAAGLGVFKRLVQAARDHAARRDSGTTAVVEPRNGAGSSATTPTRAPTRDASTTSATATSSTGPSPTPGAIDPAILARGRQRARTGLEQALEARVEAGAHPERAAEDR